MDVTTDECSGPSSPSARVNISMWSSDDYDGNSIPDTSIPSSTSGRFSTTQQRVLNNARNRRIHKNSYVNRSGDTRIYDDRLDLNDADSPGRIGVWIGRRFRWLTIARKRRCITLIILTMLAFMTRFYRIDHPHQVVFDEVHFGGFASRYIQRTFFFDLHPPTGKLLIALGGWLGGYDGSFTFKDIGLDYFKANVHVPYVAMRAVPALFGVALVPLTFMIMAEFGFGYGGAVMAASMVLLDNAMITQSRLILLDSMLVLFIACTVYSMAKFNNLQRRHSFTSQWWLWLALVGISLGLATSVKWVGLFTIALVGLHTLRDLWRLLGNLDLTHYDLFEHFCGRVLCLILLPIALYVGAYVIHLNILTISGPGDSLMPKPFRDSLRQVVSTENFTNIEHGSNIFIRNIDVNVMLHSHPHLYPSGSRQQQITGYGFDDHNNAFTIRKAKEDTEKRVQHGDLVTLEHIATDKSVYMHGYPSPLSHHKADLFSGPFEVSADVGSGHNWRIEVVSTNDTSGIYLLKGSSFRLIHEFSMNGTCALFCNKEILPTWGYQQNEVSCVTPLDNTGTVWEIKDTQVTRVGKFEVGEPIKRRSGILAMLKDIIHIQHVSWNMNSRISAYHPYGSRPPSWPLLLRGISFWQDPGHNSHIYLLGNPLSWWSCIIGFVFYMMLSLVYVIRWRRNCRDMDPEGMRKFILIGEVILLGWALHFFPFNIMGRQLFLHHYLPAQLFSILAFSGVLDHIMTVWLGRYICIRAIIVISLICTFAWSFLHWSNFVYGTPAVDMESLRWLSTWDFVI